MIHYLIILGLQSVGLTLVQDMPERALEHLIETVAFPKTNHYGSYFWVESKDDPNNLAYTAGTLGLHLDLPYYEHNPGVRETI